MLIKTFFSKLKKIKKLICQNLKKQFTLKKVFVNLKLQKNKRDSRKLNETLTNY